MNFYTPKISNMRGANHEKNETKKNPELGTHDRKSPEMKQINAAIIRGKEKR